MSDREPDVGCEVCGDPKDRHPDMGHRWRIPVEYIKAERDALRKERDDLAVSYEVLGVSLHRAIHQRDAALAEVASLREEVAISDKLLAERNRLLDLFECPVHGPCVPHAIEEVAKLRRLLRKAGLALLPLKTRAEAPEAWALVDEIVEIVQ